MRNVLYTVLSVRMKQKEETNNSNKVDPIKYEALTSTSPGFIQSYFAKSRLHHISTWKSDLAEYVTQYYLREASLSKNSVKVSSCRDINRTILHVDLDCFFASVAIRDRPQLKAKPVAVAHSHNGFYSHDNSSQNSNYNSSSEIASCNYEARAKGVRNGMFLGTARTLAPDLVVVPYEFEKYDECSKALYRILMASTNFVQAVSCDEAFADITFLVNQELLTSELKHGETKDDKIQEIAKRIAEQIRLDIFTASNGCTASVGISSNILLARLATKKAKPNGVFYIPPSAAAEHLRSLPLADLPGVGHSIVQKCAEFNLHTCGDILAANTSHGSNGGISDRVGLGGRTWATLCAFSSGRDDRVLENKCRQTVGSEINWGMRFQTDAQIEVFMKEFSEEVYNRLKKTGMSSTHITVTVKKKLYEGEPGKFLGCGHCEDLSKSQSLTSAIESAAALHALAYSLFRKIGVKPLDVRGIGIHLRKLNKTSLTSEGVRGGSGPIKRHSVGSAAASQEGCGWAQLAALEEKDEEDVEISTSAAEDWSVGSNPLRQTVLKFRSQALASQPPSSSSSSSSSSFLTSSLSPSIPPRTSSPPVKGIMKWAKRNDPVVSTETPLPKPEKRKESDIKSFFEKSNKRKRDENSTTFDEVKSKNVVCDPEIVSALPPDIVAELRDHGILQSQDPLVDVEDFLACLPEDIRLEQMQWIKQEEQRKKLRSV